MGPLHRVRCATSRLLKSEAARISLLLAVLFLVVYGATSWITGQREAVGTWCFEWEREIPFVPLMIVPYMSIDLFFLLAPFLCGDRREMLTLAKRITFAIVVAGVCFLVLPLRLAFEPPAIDGWLGAGFDAFRMLDRPHNLVPSLHVALGVILVVLYAQHTRGWVRLAVLVWFSLIGLSTVLTYQHHVVDIAGGLALGWLSRQLFREHADRMPLIGNLRVGAYYALGAAALLSLAAWKQPWSYLLIWVGGVLGIVSMAYWGVGPRVFLKRGGRLPLYSRLVLWPVLLGQYLSLVYYRRQGRAWDLIVPGVVIGRKLNDIEAAEAARQGVTAVLDLTAEFSEARPFLAMTYHNLPILDLTAPTTHQLREAVTFIAEQTLRGTVYVHCKVGYSRSATVVGAYLLATEIVETAEQAVHLMRQARPRIVVRPEVWNALRAFEQSRNHHSSFFL